MRITRVGYGIATRLRHNSPIAVANKLVPPIERRSANRLPTPACQDCGDDAKVKGVLRRPRSIYFRCTKCGRVMVIERPAMPLTTSQHLTA
jgi:tRNA(Ile2) C34 agmatinyltransferase TiaS